MALYVIPEQQEYYSHNILNGVKIEEEIYDDDNTDLTYVKLKGVWYTFNIAECCGEMYYPAFECNYLNHKETTSFNREVKLYPIIEKEDYYGREAWRIIGYRIEKV